MGRGIAEVLLGYLAGTAFHYRATALGEAYGRLYLAMTALFDKAEDLEAHLDRLDALLDERKEGAAAEVLEALNALAQINTYDADLARTLIMRAALMERVFAGSRWMAQFE